MTDHGDKKVNLTVVVNGTPVTVSANTNAALNSVLEKALKEADVPEKDPEKWEFKDEAGHILDVHKKLSELGLGEGSTVFLSLKAGVTG